MKFFIVDDDQDTIELMTALLEAAGHAVASNDSGVYALPQIQRNRPDCILTDLVMAELDGLDLCRELRARPDTRSIKIVMVSARPRDMWLDQAIAAGASGYIMKPLVPATFIEQLKQEMSRGQD